MPLSFMIVDEFLPDPHRIRNALLQAKYPENKKPEYFPGRYTDRQYLIDFVDQEIMGLTGEHLEPAANSYHAKPRIAWEGEKGIGGVHIDPCSWTGLLFLTLDEHCQGGTEFYRHKRTNMDRLPFNQEEREAIGYKTKREVMDDIVETDGTNPDAWEHTMTIPMRFNRLVLFRPWYYHDAGPSFGDNMENCRLIYPTFYVSKGILPGR